MASQISSAPVYKVPAKEIVAVEHPMIIKNIDNALQTFGRGKAPLAQVSSPDFGDVTLLEAVLEPLYYVPC